MKASKGLKEILVAFLIAIAMMAIAQASQPNSPNSIQVINTTRMQPKSAISVPAQAGNVTELNINATSVTKSWQGYYGNVTGTITLDDADNYTLYNWFDTNPQGEIYASSAEITDWTSVKCFNYSAYKPELNLSQLEEDLNIDASDADGVNETFRFDFTGSFYVGNALIDSTSSCKATYTYENDQAQTDDFVEVLLTDATNIIYTTILEDDVTGFDTRTHDFQMLVGEDGHNGDTTATDYYFYVELE